MTNTWPTLRATHRLLLLKNMKKLILLESKYITETPSHHCFATGWPFMCLFNPSKLLGVKQSDINGHLSSVTGNRMGVCRYFWSWMTDHKEASKVLLLSYVNWPYHLRIYSGEIFIVTKNQRFTLGTIIPNTFVWFCIVLITHDWKKK